MKGTVMYYVILEKDLETEVVSVHSVYEDEHNSLSIRWSL
jgi:hypothetical protein